MRITRLGLQFSDRKGFQDYHEYEFGNGWTMIIAPNGCGKSTIITAIDAAFGRPMDWNSVQIEVDFCSEESTHKISKKWLDDGKVSLSIGDGQQSIEDGMQLSNFAPIAFSCCTRLHERLEEISDLFNDCPESINEMNKMLQMWPKLQSEHFELVDGNLNLLSPTGQVGFAMGERAIIEFILCLEMSKLSNSPLLIDDWRMSLDVAKVDLIIQMLELWKESNPRIQIIATTPGFVWKNGSADESHLFEQHIILEENIEWDS
jgi:Fe-S cluster assembly ATPase SufC